MNPTTDVASSRRRSWPRERSAFSGVIEELLGRGYVLDLA
jgi:hypothetical protein